MAFEIPDWGGSDAFSYRLENKELECGTTAGKTKNKLKTKNKKQSGVNAGGELHNHTSGKRKLIDSENSQPISKKKRKKHTGNKDDMENGNQEKGKKKANQQNSNINLKVTVKGKKKVKQQNSNINRQTMEKGKKKAKQQNSNINQQTMEKGKKKAKQQNSKNNKPIIGEGNHKVNQQNSSQSKNDTEKENHKVDRENSCENQNTTDTLQATSPLTPKPTKVMKKARSKNKYRELYLKQTGLTEKTDAREKKSLNGTQEEINDEKKEGEVETEGKKKRKRKKKKKPGHLNETENDDGINSKPKQTLVLSKSNEGGGAGDQADGNKVERKKKKRRRKKKKGNPLNESKPEEMKENVSKPEEMGKKESKPQEVKERAPKRKAAEGEEETEDSGRMDVRKKLKKNDNSNLSRENNENSSENPRNNKKPSQEKKKAKGKHENAKTKEASINETQKTKKGKKNKTENTKTKEATPNETQKTKKGKNKKSENTKTKEATPNETQKTKKGKKKKSENAITNEASPKKKQKTKKGKNKNSLNKEERDDLEEMTFSDDERECDAALMSEVNAFVEELDFNRTDRPEEEEEEDDDDEEEEEDDDEEEEEEDDDDNGEEESAGSVDTDQEDNNDNNMDRKVKNSKSKVTIQEGIDMDSKNISPKPQKENAKFDRQKLMKFLEEAAESPSTRPMSSADGLKMKMEKRLAAAKFRIINEQLYTTTSQEAYDHFNSDPEEFQKYHQGYKDQVKLWPLNPLDVIVKWLTKKPKEWVVADMGCGEAELSLQVPQTKVHSFDLVASNPRVTACDMADTPLPSGSVDAAVFCLSLMGTNIEEFIVEANRILKDGGIMKIAEVESRFENYNAFIKRLTKYGFQVNGKVLSQQYFHVFDLKKTQTIKKKSSLPELHLKPCLYKKR